MNRGATKVQPAPPPVNDAVIVPDPVADAALNVRTAGGDGVTLFDAAEGGPVPIAFVAVTLNVYAVPLARPVTVCVVAVVPAFVSRPPAGVDVTAYPVIGDPPLDAGGVNETVALALPAVATTAVGAPGTPGGAAGVTVFEALDGAPVPTAFVAVTVNVYGVPFASPVTRWLSAVVPAFASTPPAGLDVTA